MGDAPPDEEEARKLVAGPLGDRMREALRGCCVPLYWFPTGRVVDTDKLRSGTLTIVQTATRLLGVTAAHVVRQYEGDQEREPQTVQAMGAVLPGMRVIDIDDRLDIATLDLTDADIVAMGKQIVPATGWPPQSPIEGRGILIGGYPAKHRLKEAHDTFNWGLYTVIGVARRVTAEEVFWLLEPEHHVAHPTIPPPPPNEDLGGISGGPVLTVVEHDDGTRGWHFAGVVSEAAHELLEQVVVRRADAIRPDGTIDKGRK